MLTYSHQTPLTFGLELWHDHRLRKKHVPHSFICMCQRSCLQHRTWGMGKKWTFEFGESTGKLGWKWRIEHTPMKGKWCNFIIWCLVVLYLCLHLYLSFRVCSVRSGEWALEKSHCTLAFKAQWCDLRWFFRCTAKNLVAYATSWSLTLSPAYFLGVNFWIKAITMTTSNLMTGRYIANFSLNSLVFILSFGEKFLFFASLWK